MESTSRTETVAPEGGDQLEKLERIAVRRGIPEQKKQVEVIWDAMKVLRREAEFHHSGYGPSLEFSPRYLTWSGRAWASYDFLDRLLRQRVALLRRSLHGFARRVDVGSVTDMSVSASLPDDPGHEATAKSGPFFETAEGQELIREAVKCDHAEGDYCPAYQIEIVD